MARKHNEPTKKSGDFEDIANGIAGLDLRQTQPANLLIAQENTTLIAKETIEQISDEMSTGARLFIASVGNPAPHYNTLHSAGHHLVDAMQSTLAYPPFSRSLSSSYPHSLYKSTSQMNVSGTNILKAYKTFVSSLSPDERSAARLVIVHDELELPLGQLKIRESGSLKGHNGLKSVKAGLGGKEFARLGVGIGRPESRAPNAVSDYVLRKMNNAERQAIEGKADLAVKLLEKLGPGGA